MASGEGEHADVVVAESLLGEVHDVVTTINPVEAINDYVQIQKRLSRAIDAGADNQRESYYPLLDIAENIREQIEEYTELAKEGEQVGYAERIQNELKELYDGLQKAQVDDIRIERSRI